MAELTLDVRRRNKLKISINLFFMDAHLQFSPSRQRGASATDELIYNMHNRWFPIESINLIRWERSGAGKSGAKTMLDADNEIRGGFCRYSEKRLSIRGLEH